VKQSGVFFRCTEGALQRKGRSYLFFRKIVTAVATVTTVAESAAMAMSSVSKFVGSGSGGVVGFICDSEGEGEADSLGDSVGDSVGLWV